MKKHDILVIGELNVDLILNKIQAFPKMGTEILADEMTLTMGSSSAIFACNSSSLGANVAFLGKVGMDDFGNLVVKSLQEKQVNTDLVLQSRELNTGATIVLNYDEDRAMVTHPGAMEQLGLDDITPAKIAQAKHLHISSIFLQPGIKPHLCAIFKMAKEAGLTTSMDTQWDPEEKWEVDFENVLPLVDLFIPNESEIMAIAGTSDLDNAIDKLKSISNTIVVKRGSEGSLASRDGKIIDVTSYLNNKVVDAIGAGDSFDAGFIVKYLKGDSLEDCLHHGNLAGAINTTAAGGTNAFKNIQQIKEVARKRFGVEL